MEILNSIFWIIIVLVVVTFVWAYFSAKKNPVQFMAALWVRMTTICINLGGAALSFLYVIWPIDLIPDIIIFFGWLDDLGMLGVGIYLLKKAFSFPNPLKKSENPEKVGYDRKNRRRIS